MASRSESKLHRSRFLMLVVLLLLSRAPLAAEEDLAVLEQVPDIRVVGWTVDDSLDGNGDGGLHPGETARLQIHLSNRGNEPAQGVVASLFELTDHPDVEILDKFATWPDLPATGAPAASDFPHFTIRVAATRPCAWEIPLRLEVTASGGYVAERTFSVVLIRQKREDLARKPGRPTVYGPDAGDQLGAAVTTADLNGDGYDEIIGGAPLDDGNTNAYPDSGMASVFYGGPRPLSDRDLAYATPFQTWVRGADTEDYLAWNLAAGDLDGDGYDDLIVSAGRGDGPLNTRDSAGELAIVYGGPAEIDSVWLGAPPSNVVRIYGQNADDLLGTGLGTGDLNGDGYDEVIVGAGFADGPAEDRWSAGEALIIYGGPVRLSGDVDLAAGALPVGFVRIYGASGGDFFGQRIGTGDLDNDGYDDLLLGLQDAPEFCGERYDAGGLLVLYGAPERLTDIDLASPPPGMGQICGINVEDRFGFAVAVADLDDDGHSDLAVSAYGADGPDNSRDLAGEIALIYGGPERIATIDLADPPDSVRFIFGAEPNDQLGTALAAGDLDGDGYDDLAVGAWASDGPEGTRSGAGADVILRGGSLRWPDIDLATPPEDLVFYHGADPSDYLGLAVAIGDVDGDGYDDLVTATGYGDGPDGTRNNAGELALLPGEPLRRYRWDPDSYAFIDATGGTDLGLGCDDCSVDLPIGFAFDFYGRSYDRVAVSSNGYLTFGDQLSDMPGGLCPAASNPPNDLIAVFWDDLNPEAGGGVYALLEGTAPNRRLTVEWHQVPLFPASGAGTFEVTLFETTNQILLQYQDTTFGGLSDLGAMAVAGVENHSGIGGTAISCYAPSLVGSSARRLRPFAHHTNSDPLTVEGDVSDWTMTGLWHVTDETSVCEPSSQSGERSFYYGQEGTCNIQTGLENSGDLTSALTPSLPQDAAAVFRERVSLNLDPARHHAEIQVSVDGGPFVTLRDARTDGPTAYYYSNRFYHTDDVLHADPQNGTFTPIDLSAYAGQELQFRFHFDTVDTLFNDVGGWWIDDLDLYQCPVWGTGGARAVAAEAWATAQPDTYCEGGTGRLDALGSYCAACPTLDYQWNEGGAPIPGAVEVGYTIPPTELPGSYDFTVTIGCPSNPYCTDESEIAPVKIVQMPLDVGATLLVGKADYGADLEFHWTDVAGADDYVLFSDTNAGGGFATDEGSAASGASGLLLPMPGDAIVFFIIAGRNPVCGLGPY